MQAKKKQDGVSMDIPFIQDLKGRTPLHVLQEKQDGKNMELILAELANYGFDHHARYIFDMWPDIIIADLPSFNDYMATRIIENYST